MYQTARSWEQEHQQTIDAILQVGDFETVRTAHDFIAYFAPQKYHRISDFASYASGEKQAPYLTLFIGGNHEAWSVLAPYNDGGFIAKNIYYLGRAGRFNFRDVSIGGITGVYSPKQYDTPLSSEPEYNWKFYRRENIEHLLKNPVNILLIHDWVTPIDSINSSTPIDALPKKMTHNAPSPTKNLIESTQPSHVFMGHMHHHHIAGTMGKSQIRGLQKLENPVDPESWYVFTMNPTE